MNKKDIKKSIKHEMRQSTPDILDKIDFQAIDIKKQPKRSRLRIGLKPVLVPLMALSILAILLITLLNVGEGPGPGPGNGQMAYSEKEEAYTLSALSAISLLSQVEINNNNMYQNPMMLMQLSFNDSGPSILLDDHLEQLNRNLNMIEPLIGDKDAMQFRLEASDLPAYTYKLVFTTTDMHGRTVDYTMHYNETQDDEDTFLLDGIMIIGTTTYHLEGELTIEEDGFELELLAEHPHDEDTYVKITQEVSADEHTLEYEVSRHGDTLYESELSIEFDGDNIYIEIEYESETLAISLEIERTIKNGQYVYYIEYDIEDNNQDEDGEITVHIIYDEAEDQYYYRYTIETDDFQVTRFRKRIELGS